MKNSFVLYTDYQEQLELLSMEQRGALLTAIMAYAADKALPDMDGVTKMAFSFIRANMDRDREKYEKTIEARRAAGRSGGLTKAANVKAKLANASKAKQALANLHDNVNDNVNVNVNVNDIGIGHTTKKKFTPPTREQVQEYIQERGYNVDADRFVDFYTSKGWMIGKNPMKDWKAAVRTWSRGKRETKVSKFTSYPQREYEYNNLEAALLNAQRGTV